MFIFDRCHHSSAAETPVKYELGLKYLTYTFDESKFPVTKKLANKYLVIPTPLFTTLLLAKVTRIIAIALCWGMTCTGDHG